MAILMPTGRLQLSSRTRNRRVVVIELMIPDDYWSITIGTVMQAGVLYIN